MRVEEGSGANFHEQASFSPPPPDRILSRGFFIGGLSPLMPLMIAARASRTGHESTSATPPHQIRTTLRSMKTLSIVALASAACLLTACGDDSGSRVTKVQPKPPPAASEKVPGPDDAFNANRKLGSTSDPNAAPPKKAKKD